jgi:hypothetical protein
MDENFIDNDEKIDDIIGKIMDIDVSMFKIDKNNNENEKPSIISWLLDLI